MPIPSKSANTRFHWIFQALSPIDADVFLERSPFPFAPPDRTRYIPGSQRSQRCRSARTRPKESEKYRRGYLPTEPFVTSGDTVNSTILDQYHRSNLRLNCEALDLVPPDLRSASSLTLTPSEANFDRVRREIRDFLAHLMAIAKEDPNPERMFHIGFIALSRSRKKDGFHGT